MIKMGKFLRRQTALLICAALAAAGLAAAAVPVRARAEEETGAGEAAQQEPEWQAEVTFPDWKGYTDDTLAMNSMFSFYGCHGQGTITVKPAEAVTGFRMYVNGTIVDTAAMAGGGSYNVDIAGIAKDGENTVQISNIVPFDPEAKVTVCVPYPEVLPGTPEEEGISPEALEMISELIESDIEFGFTSAQLAVVRNGRLVYENAWGKTNSYLPDGSVNTDSPAVTVDTLYDLASVTKMFTVNYALQKLVTDGAVSLDAMVSDFFGDGFIEDTVLIPDIDGNMPDLELETVKGWKAELTIRDLMRHQGGFPSDPKYCAPLLYKKDLEEGETYPVNPLYAGNGADAETKAATTRMICRTPLEYEPGTNTVYSDLDYMILGLIVEKVTGEDLDTWLKKTFWEPMGLSHITYNPLENGFAPDDCAATELNGNTRDGLLDFDGYRTYTLQGEVHDEKAYYSMQGISGHAGLFANASDLAKLASVMLWGGYGDHRFFSRNVIDQFTAPKQETAANWGLGWWRQADAQRVWYFGTQAAPGTIGHQGWTGTLFMIDPVRNLIVVYLTNKINSRVTDVQADANKFDGNWYTASTLGFVPQILSIGMDADPGQDISGQLLDLCADMAAESLKLLPEGTDIGGNHPSALNIQSKFALFERMAAENADPEHAAQLRGIINAAYDQAAAKAGAEVLNDTETDTNTETVTETDTETEDMEEAIQPAATLVMEVNGKIFYPEPADNPSAEAFLEKLEEGELTVSLHDYGDFEKVGPLPWELVRSDEEITTEPGDIILYQGNQITVYYDVNTWNFTRLAKIKNVTREELLEALGGGDAEVSFWLEWSE